MSPVTEAARMLNARVPAPWVATISKPRTDAPPKGKLTIGDDADDEV